MNEKLVVPGLCAQDVKTLINIRNYTYYCATVDNLLKGICPFCTIDPEVNKVFYENKTWRAFQVPKEFRAENLEYHFLLTIKRHHTQFCGMTDEEKKDWVKALDFVISKWDLDGGAIVMRFGDPDLNAGSVRHLHCNIMVPDKTGEVKVTLAKDPIKVEKKWKMIAVFEKLRQGASRERLSANEKKLIEGRI